MQKRQEFLWIVQSAYLANGINMSAQENYQDARRAEYSGLGVKNEMCDAVMASHLIPNDITSVKAADDYISWKLFARGLEGSERNEMMPAWITPGFDGWDRK